MPKSKEYRIVFDENGEIQVLNSDDTKPSYHEITMIRLMLHDRYSPRSYVYIAAHCHDNVYKIGVSQDPERRETEIDGYICHRIECLLDNVWSYEKALHKFFKPLRHEKEWFWLDSDSRYDFLRMLYSLKDWHDLSGWLENMKHIIPAFSETVPVVRRTDFNEIGQERKREENQAFLDFLQSVANNIKVEK